MGISVTKNVQLDASNLMGHLHDYAKVMGKNLGEVVREQAGHFCMDLAKYTGPFTSPGKGLDSSAKDKGIENARKAVFKVFQPIEFATKQQIADTRSFEVFKLWNKKNNEAPSSLSVKKQWELFQSRNPSRSPLTYVGSDLSAMSKIHNKHRKFGGKGGLMEYAKKSKSAFALARREKDIEKYAIQKAKDVGSMKAGYWYAAQKIRSKEVRAPAWVKHTSGQTYAIGQDMINQPMKPEVVVGNLVGFRAMPRGLLRVAINYRMYAMRVKMAAELNKKKIPLWLATAKGLTTNTRTNF